MLLEERIMCRIFTLLFLIWLDSTSCTLSAVEPPAATQPSASATQSIVTPGVTTQRKFADMGVLEANAILMEIQKQDLPAIFQAMLDAKRVEHDEMKQMGVQSVFATVLKSKAPSPEFIEQLSEFLGNSSNSTSERDLLLGALGSAATKETVDLLIRLATTSPDMELRKSATASLSLAGSLNGGGAKLSPSLERVWRESNDQKLLYSVATAMAKIGSPDSIELLLSSALAVDGRNDFRAATARRELASEVYRAEAVLPLAGRLVNQSQKSEAAQLIAPILVRIGDATAAKAIISWLQGLDENAGAFIGKKLFQETRTPAMVAAWEASLDPAIPFRNEKNRTAIRERLADRAKSRIGN